ncbi:MAG: SpoIID/LytB domain-containing protein [Deltaproteobacteria bacterium]|nr:SpoIID/LytB domain-containing protein [Deltaproteobacteria bacterium]
MKVAPRRTQEIKKAVSELKGETIRVQVLRGLKDVRIDVLDEAPPLKIVYNEGGAALLNGEHLPLPVDVESHEEFIYVNGRPYRGNIKVVEGETGLDVINELDVERYLVGLINNEVSSKWHIEAIKAQAVIARTYARYQKERRQGGLFHVAGTYMDQVYNGTDAEDNAAYEAVAQTKGQVLMYNGMPALAVYHSNAGGRTESVKDVWGGDYPYLKSVKSPYDKDAPLYKWEMYMDPQTLKQLLVSNGYSIGMPARIIVEERSSTDRVKRLVLRASDGSNASLTGEELRKILGYSNLKSTLFDVEKEGDAFVFRGRGSGHGVGLSQWGAKGFAENGMRYTEILEHFYQGTKLVTLY